MAGEPKCPLCKSAMRSSRGIGGRSFLVCTNDKCRAAFPRARRI